MSREFSIISAGPGHPGLLTAQARQAIESADEVYSCGLVAGSLAALRGDWKLCPPEEIAELAVDTTETKIAIVLAGDAGFFANLQELSERLSPYGEVRIYPGISSMQYLCSKVAESYDDAFWMEDGTCDLLAVVSYHNKVCLLLDSSRTVGDVCMMLHAGGLGGVRVVVGIRLGTGREQIIDSTANALYGLEIDTSAILLLLNPAASDPLRPVFDADLTTEDSAKIRQEVRWNAVNLLRIKPRDTVYDLGAGNGSVSMELARKAREGCVFAVDEFANMQSLIARNREAMGCHNVRLIHGQSATVIEPLPAPDAVFIGLGVSGLNEILSSVKRKNERVRIVIAADSIERLTEAQMALSHLRFKNINVSQILLSRARTQSSHTMMAASEAIFLLCAGK